MKKAQVAVQGFFAHKKTPPPPGPPYVPRHSPSVESWGVAFFYERSTPVGPRNPSVGQIMASIKWGDRIKGCLHMGDPSRLCRILLDLVLYVSRFGRTVLPKLD